MNSTKLQLLKKLFATATIAATMLSLAGFASTALAVAPADYGLKEGDVISAAGSSDPDVYIVNDWGYKRLFVNPAIFNLYGHLGWSKVKSVTPATRDAFGTSGLFRNCESGDPKVYGLDVISEDVANLRWVNTSGAQAVADDANFFKKVFCINNAEQALYGTGADYTSVLQVPVYSRGGLPQTGGALSATLSSDNPAGSTIIAGQAIADLLHVSFSGSGTVTSIKFKRMGVSSDSILSAVYLYDGNTRLTDSATVTNGEVTFNDLAGLFSVSGARNISVRSNIDSTAAAGQTVSLQLLSYTVGSTANAVTVTGNQFTVAAAPLDFSTAAFGTVTPALNASLDPQDGYVTWQSTLTVGNHYVWLKALKIRVIGSVLSGDLRNFKLMIDGVEKGSLSALDSQGYLNFDFGASPVKLETGGRVVKVMADVVGGSSKDFTFSLRNASDVLVMDSQYNQPVLATGTFPADAGKQTIGTGTLTFTKRPDSASGDVVKGSSNVSLGKWDVKAFGEKMKVENLRVAVTYAPLGVAGPKAAFTLRNGALYADGVQIGSTQSLCSSGDHTCTGYLISASSSYTLFNLGSSLVIDPGQTKVIEVRADIYDNDGSDDITATDTLQAFIDTGSNNVQPLTSLSYKSYPASDSSANAVTVKTGSMTLAKYTAYANQNTIAPKANVKLGHYVLTGASSEDVNVNTINVDLDGTSTFVPANVNNVYVKVWNDAASMILQTSAKSTVSATASNSFSVNFTLPKSKSYQIEVYGDVTGSALAGTLTSNVDVSGITAQSSTTATSAEVFGQGITVQTGSVSKSLDGSSPVSRLVAGGTTITGAAFNFLAANDDFTMTEFGVDVATSADAAAIANVIIKDGGNIVATLPFNGASASFTGLSIPLVKNVNKVLTVDLQLSNIGIGFATSSLNAKITLDNYKVLDSNGNITSASGLTTAGNNIYPHKSYPTITAVSLPSSLLQAGEQTLAKFSVSANGSEIAWRSILFNVTKTSTPNISSSSYKLFEDGVDISSSGTFASSSLGAGQTSGYIRFTSTAERPISTTRTYELKVSVSATGTAGDSISSAIKNPSGSTPATPDAETVVRGNVSTGASFTWTDKSASSHSLTTGDWMTDALVKDLPTSQALTK